MFQVDQTAGAATCCNNEVADRRHRGEIRSSEPVLTVTCVQPDQTRIVSSDHPVPVILTVVFHLSPSVDFVSVVSGRIDEPRCSLYPLRDTALSENTSASEERHARIQK